MYMQVGGSGKNKIPKTEEIQSMEYKFRAESATVSEWEVEQQSTSAAADKPSGKNNGLYIYVAHLT